MPHGIIEYSSSISSLIDVKVLMSAVHKGLKDSTLFEAQAIKVRSIAFEEYMLQHLYEHFIHVRLHLLQGRDIEQKKALAYGVHQLLLLRFSEPEVVSITTEVIDIEKESYHVQ